MTTYGELKGLLLDGLLQFNVVPVGDVEGHLEFGDLDLELLLDALDFRLKLGFSLNHAGVQLLDLDGGLLAEKPQTRNIIQQNFLKR